MEHVSLKEEPRLPTCHDEALQWLMELVRATDETMLKGVPDVEFKRGWSSIGFLYPGLHPDSAHGEEVSHDIEDVPEIVKVEPRLMAPYFTKSGWPVVLVPILNEAWRRYRASQLSDSEFYCARAVMAGIFHRNALE